MACDNSQASPPSEDENHHFWTGRRLHALNEDQPVRRCSAWPAIDSLCRRTIRAPRAEKKGKEVLSACAFDWRWFVFLRRRSLLFRNAPDFDERVGAVQRLAGNHHRGMARG